MPTSNTPSTSARPENQELAAASSCTAPPTPPAGKVELWHTLRCRCTPVQVDLFEQGEVFNFYDMASEFSRLRIPIGQLRTLLAKIAGKTPSSLQVYGSVLGRDLTLWIYGPIISSNQDTKRRLDQVLTDLAAVCQWKTKEATPEGCPVGMPNHIEAPLIKLGEGVVAAGIQIKTARPPNAEQDQPEKGVHAGESTLTLGPALDTRPKPKPPKAPPFTLLAVIGPGSRDWTKCTLRPQGSPRFVLATTRSKDHLPTIIGLLSLAGVRAELTVRPYDYEEQDCPRNMPAYEILDARMDPSDPHQGRMQEVLECAQNLARLLEWDAKDTE